MRKTFFNKEIGFANTLLMILAFMGGVIVASHWYLRSKDGSDSQVNGNGMTTVAVENVAVEETSESTEAFGGAVAGVGSERDIELVKEAFVQKYGKSLKDIDVIINKVTDTHMLGSVSFAGDFGSSWFLAVREEGEDAWDLVGMGEDAIPCNTANTYGFESDMVPECWDVAQEVFVSR